ncbi:DNA/RNA non-specific endonuclease [Symmachiella dynata]|uniref:DNA/RNA non-specific endonuclease n=1 Tax=Symmachiella dynata TaxID=2527995 RepID=UPI003B82E9DE
MTGRRGANRARGHLLGDQLGGSGNEVRNLDTLEQNAANSPVMRGYEAAIRQAVEGGRLSIPP